MYKKRVIIASLFRNCVREQYNVIEWVACAACKLAAKLIVLINPDLRCKKASLRRTNGRGLRWVGKRRGHIGGKTALTCECCWIVSKTATRIVANELPVIFRLDWLMTREEIVFSFYLTATVTSIILSPFIIFHLVVTIRAFLIVPEKYI